VGQNIEGDALSVLFAHASGSDRVTLGKVLWEEQGWLRALCPTPRGLVLGYGRTLPSGPTPIFRWLISRGGMGTGAVGVDSLGRYYILQPNQQGKQ